jgi:hypothetical protein
MVNMPLWEHPIPVATGPLLTPEQAQAALDRINAHERIVHKVTRAITRLHLDFEEKHWGKPSYESIARVAVMTTIRAQEEEARHEGSGDSEPGIGSGSDPLSDAGTSPATD